MAVWECQARASHASERSGREPAPLLLDCGQAHSVCTTLCSLTRLPEFPTSLDEFSLGDLLTVGEPPPQRSHVGHPPPDLCSNPDRSYPSPSRGSPGSPRTTMHQPVATTHATPRTRPSPRPWKRQCAAARNGKKGPFGLLLGGERGAPYGAPARRRPDRHSTDRDVPSSGAGALAAQAGCWKIHRRCQPPGSAFFRMRRRRCSLPRRFLIQCVPRIRETGPIFHSHQLRQLLRPEVYPAIHGVATDTIERAYRDAHRGSPRRPGSSR